MPRMILVDLKGPSLPRHPCSTLHAEVHGSFPLGRAENFGALPNINALYGTESDDEEETDDEEQPKRTEPKSDVLPLPLISGRSSPDHLPSFLCRPQRLQVGEPIAPSPYQTYLSSTSDDPTPAGPPELANPRYWSDYNRVFYHPRSLLPLEPRFRRTTAEDENGMAKWDEGLEAWDSLRKVRPPTPLNQTLQPARDCLTILRSGCV